MNLNKPTEQIVETIAELNFLVKECLESIDAYTKELMKRKEEEKENGTIS